MNEYRKPSASELISEAPRLRRLLGDSLPAHAVDDALHDTWTVAMRGVPASAAALRPWLSTVSKRVAGRLHLGEARRRVPERRVARPESQPAIDELIVRLDLQRRVTAIVRDLPEPHRATVLLRY